MRIITIWRDAGPGDPGHRSAVGHVRRRCLRAGADVAGACRTHLQPAAEEQQAQARCPARTGECIGKGKARMPYEFGVRTGIVKGLVVGVRSFLGNRASGVATLRSACSRSEEHTSDLQSLMRTAYSV